MKRGIEDACHKEEWQDIFQMLLGIAMQSLDPGLKKFNDVPSPVFIVLYK